MRRPTRIEVFAVLAAVGPWTWYLVRDLHGWFDAIAIAWPVLGAFAVLVLIARAARVRRFGLAVAAASWIVAWVTVVALPWTPRPSDAPASELRIVAANVGGDDSYEDGVLGGIADQRPDLLVLSEVDGEAHPAMARMFRQHGWGEAVRGRRDVVLYSNLPMTTTRLPAKLRDQYGVRAVVEGPSGNFVLYALHVRKPNISPSRSEVGFRSHRRIVDALVDAASKEDLPVVVAGDLNLVERTSGYRQMTERFDDAMRDGWTGPTSLRIANLPLLARVDHIFMPSGWCSDQTDVFTLPGSDHRGIAATVGPCPSSRR